MACQRIPASDQWRKRCTAAWRIRRLRRPPLQRWGRLVQRVQRQQPLQRTWLLLVGLFEVLPKKVEGEGRHHLLLQHLNYLARRNLHLLLELVLELKHLDLGPLKVLGERRPWVVKIDRGLGPLALLRDRLGDGSRF